MSDTDGSATLPDTTPYSFKFVEEFPIAASAIMDTPGRFSDKHGLGAD
jgi:hypothetical protein